MSFLAAFFFLPFVRILASGLSVQSLSAANLRLVLETFGFTVYQATLSTILTLALGLPAAFLFARYRFPGRSLLYALTAVPFMLPTVVVAAGFSALFGPRGWANLIPMGLLGLATPPISFIGTLGAILIAHVFYNTTIVIRLVGGALGGLDPKWEQAGRSLGADSRSVWWRVVLPMLRAPLLAATLLVFLFDFTSFGVILLLGGPAFATVEVQIYTEALYLLNLPVASLLAFVQLLFTIGFSVLYTRLAVRARVQAVPRAADSNRRAAAGRRERSFVILAVVALTLFFVLPMLALPLRSISRLDANRGERGAVQAGLTTEYYSELFSNARNSIFYVPPIQAAANSLTYASATVLLSLALGFPAASALAKPGRLEKVLDPILILPLGASAVTLGSGIYCYVWTIGWSTRGWCRLRTRWWRCPLLSARFSRRLLHSRIGCARPPPRWAPRRFDPGRS